MEKQAQGDLVVVQSGASTKQHTTMAELFVEYYADWQHQDTEMDLHEYLRSRDLLGDDYGQINFLSWWSCLPKDRPQNSITDYAVMDFGDGSIAIHRNHDHENYSRWLVAR